MNTIELLGLMFGGMVYALAVAGIVLAVMKVLYR